MSQDLNHLPLILESYTISRHIPNVENIIEEEEKQTFQSYNNFLYLKFLNEEESINVQSNQGWIEKNLLKKFDNEKNQNFTAKIIYVTCFEDSIMLFNQNLHLIEYFIKRDIQNPSNLKINKVSSKDIGIISAKNDESSKISTSISFGSTNQNVIRFIKLKSRDKIILIIIQEKNQIRIVSQSFKPEIYWKDEKRFLIDESFESLKHTMILKKKLYIFTTNKTYIIDINQENFLYARTNKNININSQVKIDSKLFVRNDGKDIKIYRNWVILINEYLQLHFSRSDSLKLVYQCNDRKTKAKNLSMDDHSIKINCSKLSCMYDKFLFQQTNNPKNVSNGIIVIQIPEFYTKNESLAIASMEYYDSYKQVLGYFKDSSILNTFSSENSSNFLFFQNQLDNNSSKERIIKKIELQNLERYFKIRNFEKEEPIKDIRNKLTSYISYPILYDRFFEFFFVKLGQMANNQEITLIEFQEKNNQNTELLLLHEFQIETDSFFTKSYENIDSEDIIQTLDIQNNQELQEIKYKSLEYFELLNGKDMLKLFKGNIGRKIQDLLDNNDLTEQKIKQFFIDIMIKIINPTRKNYRNGFLLKKNLRKYKRNKTQQQLVSIFQIAQKINNVKVLSNVFNILINKYIKVIIGKENKKQVHREKVNIWKLILDKFLFLKKNKKFVLNQIYLC